MENPTVRLLDPYSLRVLEPEPQVRRFVQTGYVDAVLESADVGIQEMRLEIARLQQVATQSRACNEETAYKLSRRTSKLS